MTTELWCTCRSAVGYTRLQVEESLNEAWVCAECYKPSFLYFDSIMAECDDCGRSFCTPWEVLCSFCVRSGSPERPPRDDYRGWKWGRIQHKLFLDSVGIKSDILLTS